MIEAPICLNRLENPTNNNPRKKQVDTILNVDYNMNERSFTWRNGVIMLSFEQQKKREIILNVTLDVIDEMGLQSATMSRIVKRSGLAVGTIYNFFKSKEDLVNALYLDLLLKMSDFIKENDNENVPSQVRFYMFFKEFAHFSMRFRKEFKFLDDYAYSPYIFDNVKKKREETFLMLEKIFEHVRSDYSIKDVQNHHCLLFVYGALSSLVRDYTIRKIELPEATLIKTLDMCWDALIEK